MGQRQTPTGPQMDDVNYLMTMETAGMKLKDAWSLEEKL